MILAIDPGPVQSAYCLLDTGFQIRDKGKVPNDALIGYILAHSMEIGVIAVEMIASYGMAVGAETFETCVMIGRIEQAALQCGIPGERVMRMEEKMRICHNSRANDANIRRALIDRFARHDRARGTGTKKQPDWFFGVKGDIWAAFAVGVVYLDRKKEAQADERQTDGQ